MSVSLHHRITGPDEGQLLFLGPSLGTTLSMWDRQRPLAGTLRLVSFDHRGHGQSPVPEGPSELADLGGDVLRLMDELGAERASYCGVSLGAMVGMWLAIHAPERIDRLVLIGAAAHMPPASTWQERAAAVLAAGSPEPVADAVVDRWLTPAFAATRPDLRAELRGMLVSTPPDGYASCCRAIERMDLREELSRISAPTLVISGADDLSTPVVKQEEIVAAIPGARHEIVSPAAHLAPVEQPEMVNRLVEEHVRIEADESLTQEENG
jgi:3-oxoadipate enol-lactonase